MRIFHSKKKKKKKERTEIAREKTLKRIESFKIHLPKKNIEDNSIQFFHIVRSFFADLFKIRYEFTFEELDSELNRKKVDKKLKEKIAIFLKKISAVEYSDEKLSSNEIKKLFEEFKEIFKKLTVKKEENKDKGIHSFLKRIFPKKQKQKEKPKGKIISFLLKIRKKKTKLRKKRIHNMLIKALDLVNNNRIYEGKRIYLKIKKEYNLLDNNDKKQFYSDIMTLYKELVSKKN